MTTSRSIPDGICRVPDLPWSPLFLSISAILLLWVIAADVFDTILIAAVCPVYLCFASRTRPVVPSPRFLPSCHGPTWVFRFPWFDMTEFADKVEFRLDEVFGFAVGERQLLSTYLFCSGGLVTIDIGCGELRYWRPPIDSSPCTKFGLGQLLTLLLTSTRGARTDSGLSGTVFCSIAM